MNQFKNFTIIACSVCSLVILSACAPAVGSDEWCDAMNEKSKSDWTASEAGDYTKYCLLGVAEPGSSEWCEKMKDKPDDEMTVEDAKIYAKDC